MKSCESFRFRRNGRRIDFNRLNSSNLIYSRENHYSLECTKLKRGRVYHVILYDRFSNYFIKKLLDNLEYTRYIRDGCYLNLSGSEREYFLNECQLNK